MRIALAGEGTRGDLHPLLGVGEGLLALGHEVVVCAPPDFGEATQSRGMEFRSIGIDVREYLTAEAHAITGGGLKMLRAIVRYGDASIRAQFERLPEATADADLVVSGGVQVAAASAAELHGIPYRYVIYCPALLQSAEHPPVLVSRQTLPRWANRLAWRLTLRGWDRLIGASLNRERRALGLPAVACAYTHLLGRRPLLATDADLAPAPADCPVAVEQLRCLHPLRGEALPEKLADFLAQGPAPVYIGFGSMTDPDPAATTRCILSAVERAGCRALIGAGWAGLGDGPLPEGVLAIGSVSHAELFPRVAAVVHHGGAGTTTTAARAGVPQLVVPHVLDQFYWADRVQRLGLGPPPLPRRGLRADALGDALRATLDNELAAERARELGERMRARAASGPDPALALIAALAA